MATCFVAGAPPAEGAVSASTPWVPMAIRGATTDYNDLVGVSCPPNAGKFCMAVGYGGNSGSGALAEVWKNGSWRIVEGPAPSNGAQFEAVSCTSATFCMAVGRYVIPNTVNGGLFADEWNGSAWTVTLDVPNILGDLDGVSCIATQCLTVGRPFYTTTPIAEYWDGQNWTSVVPSGVTWALDGVSCISTGQCLVPAGSSGLKLYDSGTWTDEAPPDSVGLFGCTSSATSCLGLGDFPPVAEVWNGSTGTWTVVAPPIASTASQQGIFFDSVSCVTATWCIAGGDSTETKNQNFDQPSAELWNGSSWTVMDTTRLVPLVGSTFLNGFASVSCPTTTFCVGVGERGLRVNQEMGNNHYTQPAAASWGTAP